MKCAHRATGFYAGHSNEDLKLELLLGYDLTHVLCQVAEDGKFLGREFQILSV